MALKDIEITYESFDKYDEDGSIVHRSGKTVIKYIGQVVAVFKDDSISTEAITVLKSAIDTAFNAKEIR